MTALGFTNDWVQLPEDGSGKKTGYYRWDTGGGNFLYLGAGVVVGPDGVIVDVITEANKNTLAVRSPNKSATVGITTTTPDNATIDCEGTSTVIIDITGTFTGTLSFQYTLDDTNWYSCKVFAHPPTNTVGVSNTSAIGKFSANVSGYSQFRVLGPTSSGTANVVLSAGAGTQHNAVATTSQGYPIVAIGSETSGTDAVPNSQHIHPYIEDGSTTVIPMMWANANYVFGGTNWDRARSIDAYVTASAAPTLGIAATLAPDRRFTSVSLGTVVGNTQSWDTQGADCAIVHVGTSTTGTYIFEVSADGSNWISAEVRDVATDLWVSGQNLTPTANKVYRVVTNGWRNMRVRTVTTLGATMACITTLAQHSTVLNAIDSGPAPHAIGYTHTGKTVQVSTTQAGTDVWTPASGKKIVVTSYQIQAGGTTAGTVQLWFGANADTTYSRGTDLAIFDGEFAPSATLKPGVVQSGVWVASAVDHEIHLTTSANITLTVTVWGYEI